MTLVRGGGGVEGGGVIRNSPTRAADAGCVDAWMLTVLAFKQCSVISCK